MTRTIGILTAAALIGSILVTAVDSLAGKHPESATYLYYIKGKYIGKSSFTISEDKEIFIFESRSDISLDDYKHSYTARTEVEKETLKPRFFKYEGTEVKDEVSGTLWVEGDSVSADNAIGEDHFPSGSRLNGPTYLFQDYFAEHQVIILWAVSRAEELIYRFNVLLPTDFLTMPAASTIDSEIELATPNGDIVCKKYGVAIQNSSAYFMYLDPKQDIPVYMDFEGLQAEAFLQSAFGENPQTKYTDAEPGHSH